MHNTNTRRQREREQGIKKIFDKIMTENFPKLVKEKEIYVLEAQKVPKKMKPNRLTLRFIIIKMLKVKDTVRILNTARERQLVTYTGAPIGLSADFSTETFQVRKDWQKILKVVKYKNLQPRLLYPGRLSFDIKSKIKSFQERKS